MVLPARYLIRRALFLVVTLIIGVYLIVVIANFGGFYDKVVIAQIKFEVSQTLSRDPKFASLPPEERERIINQTVMAEIKARGLDTPFIVRSLIYLKNALTLNLGRAFVLRSASGSSLVKDIILERLPASLLLFTTGTLLYILIGISVGLNMARKAGSLFDRVMIFLAILTSVVPPWFFGLVFILIFAHYLRLVPYGGLLSVPPPEDPLERVLDIMYHMALPLFTWVFTFFWYWAYITRNIVIQISLEDFVMAAIAKGLPEKLVLRRYILRPSLPPIVTMSALALISSWMGAIITETVFNWPGLGRLYYEAITSYDPPVIIGLTVIYAYLLVITVFLLDIVYAILDPRIRYRR